MFGTFSHARLCVGLFVGFWGVVRYLDRGSFVGGFIFPLSFLSVFCRVVYLLGCNCAIFLRNRIYINTLWLQASSSARNLSPQRHRCDGASDRRPAPQPSRSHVSRRHFRRSRRREPETRSQLLLIWTTETRAGELREFHDGYLFNRSLSLFVSFLGRCDMARYCARGEYVFQHRLYRRQMRFRNFGHCNLRSPKL